MLLASSSGWRRQVEIFRRLVARYDRPDRREVIRNEIRILGKGK